MAEFWSLTDLTMDQKQTAFDKTRAAFAASRNTDCNLTNVKLVLITEQYYDLALKFAQDNFMTKEIMKKVLRMQWTDELETFWLKSFKLNLSLMFINEENNEPMAYVATRIARYDDNSKLKLESIKDESLRELLRSCTYGDRQADFFGHFGINEAFQVSGLAVAEKYQQRGLATDIFNTAIDMILNFGIDPVYVKVEGSSNFSKRIFENAGFKTLYELFFATYEIGGKFLFQGTGIHKSLKFYGMKLEH